MQTSVLICAAATTTLQPLRPPAFIRCTSIQVTYSELNFFFNLQGKIVPVPLPMSRDILSSSYFSATYLLHTLFEPKYTLPDTEIKLTITMLLNLPTTSGTILSQELGALNVTCLLMSATAAFQA